VGAVRRARPPLSVHLLLTDRLSCPRCGPEFGLVLRSDRMEDRLVLDGVLGCPNCRDSFPIVDGFADLRAPPREELGAGLAGTPAGEADGTAGSTPASGGGAGRPAEEVARLVALMGIVGGPGTLALVGGPARLAAQVAEALPELLVVGVDADLRRWPETPAVSRIVAEPGIPLFGSSLRAVAVDGRLGSAWLAEAARVVQPRARVVVQHASPDARGALEASGLTVLVEEAETVVAARG